MHLTDTAGGGALGEPPREADSTPPDDLEDTGDSSEDGSFHVVKVFYGTDRQALVPGSIIGRSVGWPVIAAVAVIALAVALGLMFSAWRRWWLGIATVTGVAAVALVVIHPHSLPSTGTVVTTLEYGNQRGELQVGECEVTIPNSHVEGQIERPSVWRLEFIERSDEHIVLRTVERREPGEFFQSVRERVKQSPRKDLFVFIHGYNVSFEVAARRTAQMAHDLEFQGAPIFYSWPSQGGLLRYTIDENNVTWTAPHLKKFLTDLIAHSGADSINLIAHSMGNRALAETLSELAEESQGENKQFNQVVLAAPDIDAEVFRRDIAPAVVKTARHVTLYASSRDHALQASKVVHGYPRAGDSGEDLVVVPGIDTIDVSEADLSILGHSYYANSRPIVHDLEMLLVAQKSASQRQWLAPSQRDGLTYWVFDVPAATARAATAGPPQ